MDGSPTDVSLTIDGPIARLVLSRPDDQNRLTEAALTRLGEIAAALAPNPDVHVVVIRGQGGDTFSMGILNPTIRARMTKDDVLRVVFLANAVYDAIEALPQIVIAGINGMIRAGAAVERVDSVAAVQRVVAGIARDRVVAAPALEHIGHVVADDDVVAAAADRILDRDVALDREVTAVAIDVGEGFRIEVDQLIGAGP